MIGRVLALLARGLMAAPIVLGRGAAPAIAGASVALALAGAALAAPAAARAVTALLALLAVVGLTGIVWQLVMALAVAAFLGLARLAPDLAPAPGWRDRGALPWGWIAAVAGVTPLALVGWVVVLRPDLADVVATYGLRDHRFALLLAGAALFALLNALLEELIWRGVLQDRLTALFGATAATALQGIHFGLAHWSGVPRGPAGVLLAGAWGVMLGALRRHAGGLLAPVIAHVIADTVIAVILLARYR